MYIVLHYIILYYTMLISVIKYQITMFNNIIEIEQKYDISFKKFDQKEHIIILDIFNEQQIYDDDYSNQPNILYFFGVHCGVKKDYNKMKEYYLKAIELNHSDAMNNLGYYYHFIEKDYNKMKEYYLKAIELNNTYAMNNLGYYYKYIEKDYNKMKEYFLKAIELNNVHAMNNFGIYYLIEKDYDKMKEYFLKAIELNNSKAMCNLKNNITNLELYIILSDIANPNNLINDNICELKKLNTINNYINKKKYAQKYNTIDECGICYETKLNVIVDNCMHSVCEHCYIKIVKCPFCNV